MPFRSFLPLALLVEVSLVGRHRAIVYRLRVPLLAFHVASSAAGCALFLHERDETQPVKDGRARPQLSFQVVFVARHFSPAAGALSLLHRFTPHIEVCCPSRRTLAPKTPGTPPGHNRRRRREAKRFLSRRTRVA